MDIDGTEFTQEPDIELSSKDINELAAFIEDDVGVDATILDGAALVNMLQPRGAKTFDEYASKIFIPHFIMEKQMF